MKNYKLMINGGYGRLYTDSSKTIVCKRLPKQLIIEGSKEQILFSTIIELVVTTISQSFPGTPILHNIEVKSDEVNIYMNNHGLTLQRWISKQGNISKHDAYLIMRNLIITLLHFKSARILHTDIKPCNILLLATDGPPDVTLIDYNCMSVAKVNYNNGKPYVEYSGAMATYNYAAPELIFNGRPTETSCVWSLGLIACLLFGGEYPIPKHLTHDDNKQWRNTQKEWANIFRMLQIGNSTMPIPPYILTNMGDDFKLTAWLSRAFAWEPTARPSLEEIAVAMVGVPLPQVLHIPEHLATPFAITYETRMKILERMYGLAIDTQKQSWYASAVYVFDCYCGERNDPKLNEAGVAAIAATAWVISGCLHNSYVLDSDTQTERLYHYFKVIPEYICEHVWSIGKRTNWKLWGRPIDVILIQDHNIALSFHELMNALVGVNRQWTPTSYAAIIAFQHAKK